MRSAWRRAGRGLFAAALFAAALLFIERTIGAGSWRAVLERIASARRGSIGLALAANLGVYSVWALRWKLLLRPVANPAWWTALRALMASIFVNTVVPFARSLGGLVRSAYLGRTLGVAIGPLYGATLIDQIGYSAVSLSLGALSLPLALWAPAEGRSGTTLVVLAAASATILTLILLRHRRGAILAWVRRRAPSASGSIDDAVSAAKLVVSRPASWIAIAIGGSAVWLLNVVTFVLAGRAVGAGFGFGGAAAAWSLGSLAGVASGTPGGAGTTESAALVPLLAAGASPSGALAAVLVARTINYAVALLIGGSCALAGGTVRRAGPGVGN